MTSFSPTDSGTAGTKSANRRCPICSSVRVEILHTQRFELPPSSPLPSVYDIVSCPQCGMVYADTSTTQKGYDLYYAESSKYEDPAVATGGGASDLDQRRLSELADQIELRVPKDARILDIGCAGGGLLAALRERGFLKLSGTDAAPDCVRQVVALGIAGYRLPLSELATLRENGSFDLVILSHVLEHVVDVRRLMEDAASLTALGGLVYVETPDAERYLDHVHVPFYFFDTEHINHFDRDRLIILAESIGLAADGAGLRVLQVASDKTYPACFVWMRRMAAKTIPGRSAGQFLRDRISEYVRLSREAGLFLELEALAASQTPLIVWGAGSFAQRLFGNGSLSRCNIVAIVDRDRNKQARSFGGFIVETPESALRRFPDATVVVAAAIQDGEIVSEARRIRGAEAAVVTLTPKHETHFATGRSSPTE